MKIGLDFDDVIFNTSEYKVKYLAEKLGDSDIKIDSTELAELKVEFYEDLEGSLENLKPNLYAIESIHKLIELDHSIKVVTSRYGKALENAKKLLTFHKSPELEVIGVGYRNPKLPFVQDLNVFIDDDPKNLEPMIGTVAKLFIMNTEENHDYYHPKIIRVTNWSEFMDFILSEF